MVAAGTGPPSLTRIALIATGRTEPLTTNKMTIVMAVVADALTWNLCIPSQKGVSATIKTLLLTKEAHGTRTGRQRPGQCMTNMMRQEVAGCAPGLCYILALHAPRYPVL